MEVTSLVAALLIVYMVLPGNILLRAANAISPRYSNSQIDTLLLSVSYSMVISALFFVITIRWQLLPTPDQTTGKYTDYQIMELLIGGAALAPISMILGLLLGLVRRSDFLNPIYERLNLTKGQSSWDYMFESLSNSGERKGERKSGKREKRYVIVYLRDGTKIYGVFGSKSHASMSATGQSDIFLEEACIGPNPKCMESQGGVVTTPGGVVTAKKRNAFQKQRATKGVYIAADVISCMKLYNGESSQEEGDKKAGK